MGHRPRRSTWSSTWVLGVLTAVDGGRAAATANVVAVHRKATHLGNPLWTVGGTYDYGLARTADGWVIDQLRLTVQWADGNQHLRPADPWSEWFWPERSPAVAAARRH
jgi:hypothetical protein